MEFKQVILELMNPNSELISPEADLIRLLQSSDIHPDDTKSMASKYALIKLNLLDPNSDSFDSDLGNLWKSVLQLEKDLPEVNALVLGLKAVLKKYARLANVQLSDTNSTFNVADIDTAVDNFNKTDAVQNSLLLQNLRVSGLLTESELNKCLFSQKTSVSKSVCHLMETYGCESSIPTMSGAKIVLGPDDLGVDLMKLTNFCAELDFGAGRDTKMIDSTHYFQIVEWLNTDVQKVLDQFGNGTYTENVFNVIYGKVFYLLIDSILSAKTTPIEKLPYLKFLYRDASYLVGHAPAYAMGVVIETGIMCIIGKIELEVFGTLNESTKREISSLRRVISSGTTNYPDQSVIERLKSWLSENGIDDDTFVSQMNQVFSKSAWARIRSLGKIFPGVFCCLQLSDDAVSSVDLADGHSDPEGSLAKRLQVDSDSDVESAVKESVQERVRVNHDQLISMRRSTDNTSVGSIIYEQSMYAAYLKRLDPSCAELKIALADVSKGRSVLESTDGPEKPIVTERYVVGVSK